MEIIKDKVRNNTPEEINRLIDRDIEESILYYSKQPPDVVKGRVEELDKEWDIERTLEMNASGIAFSGVLLAAFVNRRWLVLPGIVSFFLGQHALQGWCPPLMLFRKMKIRTRKEIDKEKYGLLKSLKATANE